MISKKSHIFTLASLFLLSVFSISSIASEKDMYNFSWLDPDKEVYVLQNRKYRKVNRLHINLGFGITTSGAFVDAKTFQGRAGYFFKENWGVEFVYARNSGEENGTAALLRSDGRSVPFRRIVDNYFGGMVMWSPFYSKINTFNKIIYVDWLFGLGAAKLTETNNLSEFKTTGGSNTINTLDHSGLMWDVGMKIYLTKNFEFRLDVTTIHYKANRATRTNQEGESVYNTNWDIAGSIGYTF